MRLIVEQPQHERPDTKDRILDAAERMFAQHGFELTSLRALTTEADVNLAAVHYHFRSKEGLLEAVLQRLVAPVNEERLALLDALEAHGHPTLEGIIEAFVAPPLRLHAERPHPTALAPLLIGRCLSSPDTQMRTLVMRLFGPVFERFRPAFGRALPHLPPDEILWRVFFLLGIMTKTMVGGHQLKLFSEGRCDPTCTTESIPRIVQFVAAGMRAPAFHSEVDA
ncbi:MAG: TetR family transcriptional regulator [Luteitalea sp.]|nr:TetR family transcriptional regulator [Luteitalea sp.]